MSQHMTRLGLSLSILLIFLLNTSGVLPISAMDRLENFSYDTRLTALMPNTIDERVVIIDIDEKSLKEQGRWPWGRDKLATLVDTVFDEYHVNTLGFDVVFAERDESSGLKKLAEIQAKHFNDNTQFNATLNALKPSLDFDQRFANSLKNRNVVLGYFFLRDADASQSGVLPTPTLSSNDFKGRKIQWMQATGFGANLAVLQNNAKAAGHFNPDPDVDGVSRKVPMLIEHDGKMYESLALAVVRTALSNKIPNLKISPVLAEGVGVGKQYAGLEWLKLGNFEIPVDEKVSTLIPYRGPQGSFPYVSASDVLNKKVDPALLNNKIVLLGTTAAGLMDLRSTPVQNIYAGVEIHANLIAGILDNNLKQHPAYTLGIEFTLLVLFGVLMTIALPLLSPLWATVFTLLTALVAIVTNLIAWQYGNTVLPIASLLVTIASIYLVNMSYGYFVEARGKKQLAGLFGQYVPPELVEEMAKNPERISLESENREMTVMFSDVRGFTTISEGLEPKQLTQLMNEFLTPMTHVIHHHRGAIDKYMGDAIMAFWGAPLPDKHHAKHALLAALAMLKALETVNQSFAAKGWPAIQVGVGLNTGLMTVGNMGSEFRMAYTIMGDAVNLGSRLEGLTKQYGVQLIVSEFTKDQVPDFAYRELDIVRVKGKNKPVAIFEPICEENALDKSTKDNLKLYKEAVKYYRSQQWDLAEMQLINLQKLEPQRYLYRMYIERIAYFRHTSPDANWDGVFNFDTK
ncbi:MAG: adenylate/guanylate cyclase domain-containing protein [Methylotenera sp.]|nr:adenylate/guanylate cyclase domain-containing protein [Methylotenera sp.]